VALTTHPHLGTSGPSWPVLGRTLLSYSNIWQVQTTNYKARYILLSMGTCTWRKIAYGNKLNEGLHLFYFHLLLGEPVSGIFRLSFIYKYILCFRNLLLKLLSLSWPVLCLTLYKTMVAKGSRPRVYVCPRFRTQQLCPELSIGWYSLLLVSLPEYENESANSVATNEGEWWNSLHCTRVGTLIVATIYLQLIQSRYMFRSFTVLQCIHQHCVQPVASDVEVVGYL